LSNENEIFRVYRKTIDRIDSEILNLLETRFLTAEQIGLIKKGLKKPILSESREAEVLEKVKDSLKYYKDKTLEIQDIFVKIMSISKSIQAEVDKS